MRIPLLLALMLAGCHSAGPTHSHFDATAKADLAAISAGRCAVVVEHVDALMAGQLKAPGLCAGYRTYIERFGKLRSEGAAYSRKLGALTVVRIPLHLDRSDGEFRESFHPDGTVAGVYLLKAGVPL